MNVCPVYGRVGGHAYGHTYPGPIGACIAPLMDPGPHTALLPQASTLCGACVEACPVKIPLTQHLLRLRSDDHQGLLGGKGPGWRQNLGFAFWRWFMGGRWRYRASLYLHRLAERFFQPLVERIAGKMGWNGKRTRPLPAPRSFREQWRDKGGDTK